ncbi:MAG TPA: PAS domain S-box protein [Polyangia bacterium]|jgi:PAS domain S-box-containing protein|nr:PAS domain S-box protein [Polyangia bacterium]
MAPDLAGGTDRARDAGLLPEAYRRVFEASAVGMAITGLDGRFLDVNASALDLFERSREQVVGHTSVELGLLDNSRQVQDIEARVREKGLVRNESRTIRLPSGQLRDVILTVEFVEMAGRRCYLSTFLDVTEQLRSEAALRQSEARLEEAQSLAHIGSWDWDLVTDTVVRSNELCRIFGVSTDEFARSPVSSYERVHPEDRDRLRESIDRAQREKKAWDVEYRILRPDGARWLHARGEVVFDEAGRAVRAFGTAQDVTDRHRLVERLMDAERLGALGAFAAGAAHEINNPLTAVVANLDFIQGELSALDQKPPGQLDELRALARDAQEGAHRVAAIMRDLTAFSLMNWPRRTLVDLHDVLDRAIVAARPLLIGRARLVKNYGTVPRVMADAAALVQSFLNILINAVEATPDGDPEAHPIVVSTETDPDGRAVVEVADAGSGMSPETLRRIFDPFFTTKAIGAGTGLGLAFCHGIVRALGGEITATSTPGAGSVFHIALPAATADLAATPATPATPSTKTKEDDVAEQGTAPQLSRSNG